MAKLHQSEPGRTLRLMLLLVVSAALLAGCREEPAEARLRARIDSMQQAVEERRMSDFIEGVAPDFAGNNAMDRTSLHSLLRVHALRNQAIGATRGPLQLEILGDRATVEFELLLTGSEHRVMPDRARALSITSGWRDVDGEWQVFYAEWEPIFN
jgi:hypothetical protein